MPSVGSFEQSLCRILNIERMRAVMLIFDLTVAADLSWFFKANSVCDNFRFRNITEIPYPLFRKKEVETANI